MIPIGSIRSNSRTLPSPSCTLFVTQPPPQQKLFSPRPPPRAVTPSSPHLNCLTIFSFVSSSRGDTILYAVAPFTRLCVPYQTTEPRYFTLPLQPVGFAGLSFSTFGSALMATPRSWHRVPSMSSDQVLASWPDSSRVLIFLFLILYVCVANGNSPTHRAYPSLAPHIFTRLRRSPVCIIVKSKTPSRSLDAPRFLPPPPPIPSRFSIPPLASPPS